MNITLGDSMYSQSMAQLLSCPNLPQIHLEAIRATVAPPEPDLSNCLLIYRYPVQPIYIQILNKNPQLIFSLIDLEFESAVNLWSTCLHSDP